MSNARYKKSLDQEADDVISRLSNVSIDNAQILMQEGSVLLQVVSSMKNKLIVNDKKLLLAQLEKATNQAQSVLRLSVFESEWGIFGRPWSADTGYLNHLVRMKNFLDSPDLNQSNLTAKYWSPNEERHWLHDKLYSFEESLSKHLMTFTDELKNISYDEYLFNDYLYRNKIAMKRLCKLIYWLIDNGISAHPANIMERLNWLAGKCEVSNQTLAATATN